MFTRYYYDISVRKCRSFTYGGLGGNDNNFLTKGQCEMTCRGIIPTITPRPSNPCTLPASPGNCRGYIQKWYFNSMAGKCDRFVWTGCGGNANNFDNEQQCKSRCGVRSQPSRPSICFEQPMKNGDNGIACMAYIPRWSFMSNTGRCEQFIYGGCGGNGNSFMSKDECMGTCAR